MAAATAGEIIALIQREQAMARWQERNAARPETRARGKVRAEACSRILGRITAHQAEPQIRHIGPHGD
jgi:hypothetical protein